MSSSSSNIIGRVLVYGMRDSDPAARELPFTCCVVDYLGDGENDSADVAFWIEHDPTRLIMSNTPNSKNDKLVKIKRLTRSQFHILDKAAKAKLEEAVSNRGIDVGACMLVESIDNHVLLIRRADHMRTFPGVWVPPGGHMNQNETVCEAALRELSEETGLIITNDILKSQPTTICLWESSYPSLLEDGMPKRHHIVLYMHCKLKLNAVSIEQVFKPDPNEVGACAMFSRNAIEVLVLATNKDQSKHLDETIRAFQVPTGKVAKPVNMPLSSFYTPSGRSTISTGTMWALEKWLKMTN